MGEGTSIGWCDHTFNTWWGCFRVSPGCTHCYAATFDKRVHGTDTDHWDRTGTRRFFGESHWNQPLKWNRRAATAEVRERVFCGSMCDWAEIHALADVNCRLETIRGRLWQTIRETRALDWLLLTKRTANVSAMVPGDWGRRGYGNVWLGTTVEDCDRKFRIDILRGIPAVVRFLSIEPLLEDLGELDLRGIHWVIAGAESGGKARPCETKWIRSIRDQCARAGVAFFLKQAVADLSIPQPLRPIRLGRGSFDKGKAGGSPMIEMPYLDGKQHVAFPEVKHAA